MNYTKVLAFAVPGMLTAAKVDFDAFIKAREKDRTAQFDIVLCLVRVVQGAIIGALSGAGYSAMTE